MRVRHLLWGNPSLMSLLTDQWNQPDQFDWVTKFLRERELVRPTQMAMALVATSAALVPVTLMAGRHRSATDLLIFGAVTAVFSVGMTVFWLSRWPTRRQSEITAVLGVVCIAAWSLAQPNAAVALLVCTAAAITGGYLAFFHSVKTMALNFGVAIVVAAIAAARLVRDTTLVTAASAFWVVWFLNLAVPVGIRGMSRAMSRYATSSYEDPLTGLLNRRGFLKRVARRLANAPITDTHLIVLMVDLDNFKRVNDTHGHVAGDQVLIAVAELLRQHTSATAAICRAGGEEFLVALTSNAAELSAIANNLCIAIAALSPRITASIGTTAARLADLRQPMSASTIEQIICLADRAMYAAKRNGGNQAQQA
jgi:diguanylate cyclase (GGDEF)-like protein